MPVLVMLALSFGTAAAHGRESAPEAGFDPAVLTEGFLEAHPDLRWRGQGLRSQERGEHAVALRQFKRAAWYADKASQAMVAEMYWTGTGVEQDRPLAYAWMDIAAERMYPDLLVFRDRYWDALDAAERAEAIERGQAVLAEYGDATAKPRLERVLRRERRRATGSRTGFVGKLQIIPMNGPMAALGFTVNVETYYAARYWEPEQYWQLHDTIWRAPRQERVDVGEPEPVHEPQK